MQKPLLWLYLFNAVHELHQQCRVEESLTMAFRWEESNRYNSWNPNVQSPLFRGTHHPTRHEPLGKQTRFQSNAKVSSTHLTSHELSKDSPGIPFKLQQRPVNLQLSADEFIYHVEELPKNVNGWNFLDYPKGAEDLNLSLTIGGDGNKVGGRRRNFFKKKTYSYPHNVINLEDSDDEISDNAKSGPSPDAALLEIRPEVKHGLQDFPISEPFLPTCVKKIPSVDIEESNSFQENSECCQEQTNSSSRGARDEPDDLSSKIQQLVSVQGLLDLNQVYQDDSSCCSDDHSHAYPSKKLSDSGLNGSIRDGTSPTTSRKREVSERLNETSALFEQDGTVNHALLDLNRECMDEDVRTQNENNSTCNSVVTVADPEPTFRFSAGMPEDLISFRDNKNDMVGLEPKPTSDVSCEKSEEDTLVSCIDQSQSSLQEGQGNRSPPSCRSYCTSDNDSSNGKTLHSGITSDVSDNQYIKTNLGSPVADGVTSEHDQRTSDSTDIQNECYNSKGESAEIEQAVQQAAEMLIRISLTHSALDQDSNAKSVSKETEIKKRERPLYSFDSFELNTLNITESSLDAGSVSSKPFEVNNTETKEFGTKLRRGRRMKDFQKEILPNLASLSRHEILEDINLMEGVLRSREYRKNRAKMVNCEENWSSPFRSRRSRVNYGGRRNQS
ncbi:hypothetical protein M5689_007827 [Euphorbia peplus]|nr:hypothetical protein M5689_007827 [Euphorbia peplus]